ncbi:MAG TPA: LuxR C-terminal-related transcriptional regulator, partial [Gaiellaceae bacterium]|nr:LuxR C-terminal-related transcriptional regulator [Gaiellaceae bacterium]
ADTELVHAVRLAAGGQHYLNPTLGAKLAAMPVGGRPGDLSDRELEVLRLIGAGRSDAAIARELVISLATAKWHAAHIRAKLDVESRTQAVLRAQALGLV